MDKEITNMNKKALTKIERTTENEVKEKLEESVTEKEDDTTEKDKFSLLRDNSYYNFQTDGEVEKELMAKCLRLILQGRLPPVPVSVKVFQPSIWIKVKVGYCFFNSSMFDYVISFVNLVKGISVLLEAFLFLHVSYVKKVLQAVVQWPAL